MSKSYPIKTKKNSKHRNINKHYLSLHQLSLQHMGNLKKRGLKAEDWDILQYKSKKVSNSNEAKAVLGEMVSEFGDELKTTPGFYKSDKTGQREQLWTAGMLIPVRNSDGSIMYFQIGNDDLKTGGKYMLFSSAGKDEGTKVVLSTHCPIINGPLENMPGTTLRVTEGPLKADIATKYGEGIPCVGLPGLYVPADFAEVLENLEISELLIALDAGEQENVDILRAYAKLTKIAQDVGIDVYIETWDAKLGKGIDDMLVAGHIDEIKRLSQDEVDLLLATAQEANPHNGEWIYIVSIERFLNMRTGQILKKGQFADKFRLRDINTANDLIADGFEQVDGITYLPDGDEFVMEDGQRKFNEWQDPEITPLKGDVEPFLNHIKYLFSELDEQNVVLDWFAFTVQFPGKKLMWMLVIIGPQGVGKSFFAAPIKGLLGKDNVNLPTNEQIHEKYTDWQKKCQVVIIEELMAIGRKDFMNKLKPIVTEDTTQMREMNTPTYPYPNRFNLIGFTNHKNALLLEDDDRRYCVLKSDAKPKDSAYYDELWQWIDNPRNIQSLKHFLLNRDISHFNPHARPPTTQAKEDMIKMSRSALEEWICNSIADYAWPFNRQIVCTPHLKARGVCPNGFEKESDYKWAKAFEKMGAIRYKDQITLSDKRRATVWLIGDQKHILENLSAKELARRYEQEQLDAENDATEIVNPIQDSEPL